MAANTPLYGRQLVLVSLLLVFSAFSLTTARLVEDETLGISRYDFRGVWQGIPGIATVYLRPVCIGRTLFVRGVMGLITVKLETDTADRYTAPAALLDYNWSLRLVDRSTNSSTPVRVFKTLDRHEGTLSFGQLEAQLPVPHQLELLVEGSPWRHELYLPECALSSDSSDHPLQQLPGSLLNDKHWVVVMLPRVLPAPVQQYSALLLSHMQYHQQLGFAGTLLLCDLHQAHDLMQQQDFNTALQQDSILLWPWQHEHPKESYPYYWQVPRYQLLTVAAWGRAMRAAFLDPDDFLLLPSGKPVTTEGSCLGLQGSQVDMLQQLHWEASMPPEEAAAAAAAALISSSSQEPQTDASGSAAAAAQKGAVLRLPRFDALIVLPDSCKSATECLQQHSRWYEQPNTQLQVSRCPVQDGGVRASRKPFVTPHEVVAMRVYTASTRGGRLDGPTTPPTCGYILHVANLLGPVQSWGTASGTIDAATWQPASSGGLGQLVFAAGGVPQRSIIAGCQPKGLQPGSAAEAGVQ